MLIRNFISENLRTDNIIRFDFGDCGDKCVCKPWRFLITGSER
jgi:hypothetical protein